MRHRPVLTLTLLLLLPACPGRGPTDDTPEGAVSLFLEAMRFQERGDGYRLLAPATRRELEARARAASEESGQTVAPETMLAVERFALRWELGRMSSSIDGDRATVTVTGSEEGQRAEVEAVRVGGHWRVVLPL